MSLNGREISRLTVGIGRRRLVADGWDGLVGSSLTAGMVLVGGCMALAGWSDGRLGRLRVLYPAGAIVVDTFKEFEQLLELCTALHGKAVGGTRLGVLSNAGYETVGMADALVGPRYRLQLAEAGSATVETLRGVLADGGLGHLVNPRNPLDLTPMAGEKVYTRAAQAFLDSSEVDALIIGIVPLTAALHTIPGELDRAEALPAQLGMLFENSEKPLIAVVDSGEHYAPLVRGLRASGMPVFRSADQAVRSLGRYLCHRAAK